MISSSRIVTSLESLLYSESPPGHALFSSSRLICAAEILEVTPFLDCSYLRFGLIGSSCSIVLLDKADKHCTMTR